jgi:pimeloyl-ACP methyl ester carboxylesterase
MWHATLATLKWTFGILVAAAVVGSASEAVIREKVSHKYPPTARLVDIGGRKIHLDCRGAGSPTVVLESGLDMLGTYAWASVHDSLAAGTRVCAYSRAGILWSDRAKRPFNATAAATDLRIALERAGEGGPVVLVGHSIGAIYVTRYTQMYGDNVAGIVFVDGSSPGQFARLKESMGMEMTPPASIFRFGARMSRTGLLRVIPTDGAPESAPAEAHRIPTTFAPVSIGAYADEIEAVPATVTPDSSFHGFGSRPLYVLTSAAPMPADQRRMMHVTDEQEARRKATWLAMQDAMATWSTTSKHEVFEDASHYIQFDRPAAVIAAVRDVVTRARAADAAKVANVPPAEAK